jgi:uncharacterized membrane protein YhaH (DUF805 family)
MYGNKSLDIFGILFGFDGRIGRAAFVGYNLLTGFLLIALFFITFSMLGHSLVSIQWVGFVGLWLPCTLALWPGTALLSKRLHDLGHSALHGIWIAGLWYLSPWLPAPLSTVLGLGGVIVAFGLIVMPGSGGPNRYGHKAGMVRISDPVKMTRTA